MLGDRHMINLWPTSGHTRRKHSVSGATGCMSSGFHWSWRCIKYATAKKRTPADHTQPLRCLSFPNDLDLISSCQKLRFSPQDYSLLSLFSPSLLSIKALHVQHVALRDKILKKLSLYQVLSRNLHSFWISSKKCRLYCNSIAWGEEATMDWEISGL